MPSWTRFWFWAFTLLVFLAGAVLALAWWDWAYPGLVWMWWRGGRVYPFFWKQLGWALAISEGTCLGLWTLARRASLRGNGIAQGGSVALPFSVAFLALAYFSRYTIHPFGVQPGSSAWTYGLVMVTATVLALPLAQIVRSLGAPTALARWAWRTASVLAVLYSLTFGFLSTARHTSFQTHALDLGTMDQAAWNTIHGRVLERTPLYRDPADGSRYENRLLDAKLELLFIPLSALYWLWPDPRILLIVQTLFLAAGSIPLYFLVCERMSHVGNARRSLLALLLAAAYLSYLPLHYINMADFHPSALMVPFLIAAWQAMRRDRWPHYYLWVVLALSCRVDAAFTALALGAMIVISQRSRSRHGLYTLALAAAWLTIDFGTIVPAVRRAYGSGAGDLVARRFGDLGGEPIEVLRILATRPAFVLAQFADREKLQTVFDLLAPLGFTSLLYPLALLPALPVLAINLLAESTWQHSVHAHYMAPVLPFLWIAAVEGMAWLSRKRSPASATSLATFVLLNTALLSYAFSPFPLGRAFRLADYRRPSAYEENLRTVIALVPKGASVCAQSDLHPHLSQRRDACLFPRCRLDDGEEAEFVILDLDPSSVKSPLGYHAFYERVDGWLEREDYGLIGQRGGALLLRRGASREDSSAVQVVLDEYGRRFYRVEYIKARLPRRLRAGELYRVSLTLRNAGSGVWSSRGQLPVRLSYRWLEKGRPLLSVPSLRTDLPHRVPPGHQVRLRAWLLTPAQPGSYTLEWDVVREGDAWFGGMGGATLRQVVTIW